ncbi:hypothetical protein Efla_005730 [Eimeria flavescens]
MEGEQPAQDLQLDAIIGFTGTSRRCLVIHPDNKRLIFALGYSIVVRDLTTGAETFLQGHDNCVRCIAISKDGKYLASGQKTHPGFVADIVLWSLEEALELARLSFHKVSVDCLDFSCDGKFLASLGGENCNTLVLWSIEERKALCGIPAALGPAKCLAFFNNSPNMLLSAGSSHVRIWEIDAATKKMTPHDCKLGKLRRTCNAVVINPADTMAYCGTQSGDVLEVALDCGLLKRSGPQKMQLASGITSMALIRGDVFVGTGDGRLHRLAIDNLGQLGYCQLMGGLTALVPTPDSSMLWAATSANALYRIDAQTLTPHLKHSGHVGAINQVAFPENCSQIVATCSTSDIRLWNAESCKELLRIQLPGVECLCIAFAPDGSSIISGWNDGKIRSFTPETGRLLFCIDQAHKDGVTAVAVTIDGTRIASGGVSGQFRVWKLHKSSQELIASRKEHRGKLCCLRLRRKSIHALTAAEDGTIIVWDMKTYTSILSVNESTIFKSATYCAEEVNILATGSDHKVHYFDALDGTKTREIEAADEGDINCIAFHPSSPIICTGGDDRRLRLWGYESGDCIAVARWHADVVQCAAFSPDGQLLVSGGNNGVLHFWRIPESLRCQSRQATCQAEP